MTAIFDFFFVIAVAAVLLAENVSSCHSIASDANYWMVHTFFVAIITLCLEDFNYLFCHFFIVYFPKVFLM